MSNNAIRYRPAAAGVVAALLLFMSACTHSAAKPVGGTPTDGTTTPPVTATAQASFEGTWVGTWTRTSPPPGSGTMTFVLHQQGQAITGTVDVASSACLTKGDISGSVTAAAVTLHTVTPAVTGNGQATGDYQGTLSGNRITGTLTVSCSLGTGVGTFDVTRH